MALFYVILHLAVLTEYGIPTNDVRSVGHSAAAYTAVVSGVRPENTVWGAIAPSHGERSNAGLGLCPQ